MDYHAAVEGKTPVAPFHAHAPVYTVPAIAGKARAGMAIIPIADERVGVQVKL